MYYSIADEKNQHQNTILYYMIQFQVKTLKYITEYRFTYQTV